MNRQKASIENRKQSIGKPIEHRFEFSESMSKQFKRKFLVRVVHQSALEKVERDVSGGVRKGRDIGMAWLIVSDL